MATQFNSVFFKQHSNKESLNMLSHIKKNEKQWEGLDLNLLWYSNNDLDEQMKRDWRNK